VSVSKKQKVSVLEKCVGDVEILIYNQEIVLRVGKKVGDKDMEEKSKESMIKLEKMLDEYKIILKELKEGT